MESADSRVEGGSSFITLILPAIVPMVLLLLASVLFLQPERNGAV